MKTLIPFFLLFLGLGTTPFVVGQSALQSIVPSQGIQGQELQVVIKGVNTTFRTGNVSVDLGDGITITAVDVRNSFTLFVSADISSTAQPGFRDVRVQSGTETLELPSAFEVVAQGTNEVVAVLEINPVQVLYASDFDPDNLAASPVVFRVTVLNDQQVRTLKTYFYLYLEGQGLVLTATKTHGEVQPAAVLSFDNRDFDEFDLNQENTALVSQIIATGILPPGRYTYSIEVREGATVLAREDGENTLLNQAGDVVIISPGTAIDEGADPAIQIAAQPLFQWISSANQFDLFLYEVAEGQRNTQEIVQQLPVYREFNITGNSFLYPLAAEPLKEGVTYAWQLRAYFNNPTGNGYFDSPLYWFTYTTAANSNVAIGSIEIVPDYLDLETNAVFHFSAIVRDTEGNVLAVKPTWTVVPDASFGTVDAEGTFRAGKNPRIGAVQVSYLDYSTHCIINLAFDAFSFDILDLIFKNAEKGVYKPNKN